VEKRPPGGTRPLRGTRLVGGGTMGGSKGNIFVFFNKSRGTLVLQVPPTFHSRGTNVVQWIIL